MLLQWAKVESEFAKEYGLTLDEVFALSWRRFRVLFNGVFTRSEDPDAPDPDAPEPLAPNTLYDTVDWDSPKEIVGPNIMEQFKGSQIHVGKETLDG